MLSGVRERSCLRHWMKGGVGRRRSQGKSRWILEMLLNAFGKYVLTQKLKQASKVLSEEIRPTLRMWRAGEKDCSCVRGR